MVRSSVALPHLARSRTVAVRQFTLHFLHLQDQFAFVSRRLRSIRSVGYCCVTSLQFSSVYNFSASGTHPIRMRQPHVRRLIFEEYRQISRLSRLIYDTRTVRHVA